MREYTNGARAGRPNERTLQICNDEMPKRKDPCLATWLGRQAAAESEQEQAPKRTADRDAPPTWAPRKGKARHARCPLSGRSPFPRDRGRDARLSHHFRVAAICTAQVHIHPKQPAGMAVAGRAHRCRHGHDGARARVAYVQSFVL